MNGDIYTTTHHMHWLFASGADVPKALRMLAKAIEEQHEADRYVTQLTFNVAEGWGQDGQVTVGALIEDHPKRLREDT